MKFPYSHEMPIQDCTECDNCLIENDRYTWYIPRATCEKGHEIDNPGEGEFYPKSGLCPDFKKGKQV